MKFKLAILFLIFNLFTLSAYDNRDYTKRCEMCSNGFAHMHDLCGRCNHKFDDKGHCVCCFGELYRPPTPCDDARACVHGVAKDSCAHCYRSEQNAREKAKREEGNKRYRESQESQLAPVVPAAASADPVNNLCVHGYEKDGCLECGIEASNANARVNARSDEQIDESSVIELSYEYLIGGAVTVALAIYLWKKFR